MEFSAKLLYSVFLPNICISSVILKLQKLWVFFLLFKQIQYLDKYFIFKLYLVPLDYESLLLILAHSCLSLRHKHKRIEKNLHLSIWQNLSTRASLCSLSLIIVLTSTLTTTIDDFWHCQNSNYCLFRSKLIGNQHLLFFFPCSWSDIHLWKRRRTYHIHMAQ